MKRTNKIFSTLRFRVIFGFSILLLIVVSMAAYRSFRLLSLNISQKISIEQQKSINATSERLNSFLTSEINTLKNLALIYGLYDDIPKDYRRDFFRNSMYSIITENSEISGIWAVFKPYSIDDLDDNYANVASGLTGQFADIYFRENERISTKEIDVNDYKLLYDYVPIFQQKAVLILAPIVSPYWKLSGTRYIVRIVIPVINDNKIIGIVGLDIDYSEFQSFFKNLKYNYIVADDDLNILFGSDYNIINRNIAEVFPYISNDEILLKNIALHNSFSDKNAVYNPNEILFYSLLSLKIKNTNKYWNLIFTTPNDEFVKLSRKKSVKILLSPVIVFVFILSFFIFVFNYLDKNIKDIYVNVSNFLIKDKELKFTKRKVTEFVNVYKVLKEKYQTIEKYKTFTDLIVNEDYDEEVEFVKNDILSDNLLLIKQKIINDQEEKKRNAQKQEIEKKLSNAIAEINDIQRDFASDIPELAYNTIKYLSDFVSAVQGGFYVVNRDDASTPLLEIKAFYSYNRRIYANKHIEFGDGLAGTCALEQKDIYTKVPPNYLEITSGLGSNPPNYIFLLPLVSNGVTLGILEFAFLNDLPKHLRSFLFEATTVIASSIANAENNARTLKFLEETREVTAQMQEKEKLMNEQIGALETLRRKNEITELDLSSILKAIDSIVYFAEFDVKTNVLSINNNLSEKLQIQTADAQMLTYYDVFMINDNDLHKMYWKNVLEGNQQEFELPVFFGKFNFWFRSILSPVYDLENKIYKIIFFAVDITEIRKKENDLKKLVVEMNEKAEQISVQETEMDEFFEEYQNLQEQVDKLNESTNSAIEEKEKAEKTLEFIQKEFQKRSGRAKRIELNLKKRIRKLDEELKNLRGEGK